MMVINIYLIYLSIVLFQVNAQVLASTFTPDSQKWILLGEAMGRVLKACSSSKQPYAQVHITTQGGLLLGVLMQFILSVLKFWES